MRRACRVAQPQVQVARRRTGYSKQLPLSASPSLLVQWTPRGGEAARQVTTSSAPRKNVASRISLWMLFPRHRFGTSVFNTPLLLILRLFYQASSFDLTHARADPDHGQSNSVQRPLNELRPANTSDTISQRVEKRDKDIADLFAGRYEKIPTTEWYSMLSASSPAYENCRVVSLTWVKALASPLSHEFVQFVVEDTQTGMRSRVIADRQETGDWVFVGWNWASNKDISDRHSLPLPLLSVTYEEPQSRPYLLSFAKVLADVTNRHPYRVMREMCWWYAEAVLETARTKYGGRLEEWKWAKLRYSLVVWTSILRRKKLATQAEEFRKRNSVEMSY